MQTLQVSPTGQVPATATMRAFVLEGPGHTALVEKPIPTPGPEEAVVRTTAALICTSDVHTVRGAIAVPDGENARARVGRGHTQFGVAGTRILGGRARCRRGDHAMLSL